VTPPLGVRLMMEQSQLLRLSDRAALELFAHAAAAADALLKHKASLSFLVMYTTHGTLLQAGRSLKLQRTLLKMLANWTAEPGPAGATETARRAKVATTLLDSLAADGYLDVR
jgi:hypothetical protein